MSRGVDLNKLSVLQFLDAAHYYIIMNCKPEEQTKLNRKLVGSPDSGPHGRIDPYAGFAAPSWWRGDTYASRSNQAARAMLKKTL